MFDTAISVVEIRIEVMDSPKGGKQYWVTSEDVPGLFLAGSDLAQLYKDIAPAIQTLFKSNRGIDVEVRPATPLESFPKAAGSPPARADRYLLFPQLACV